MTDFKMNLKFRGKIITQTVTKPNKIILNKNIVQDNSKFTNIKSIHDRIIEENLLRRAGLNGVGMAMAYACAGRSIHKGNCGCGK